MLHSLAPEITIFVRVVELGTFAAVAQETGYTSSGVSRMVSRLEDHFGARLFQRSTRKLALTQEGETFLVCSREVLSRRDAAKAEISHTMVSPKGHLRVNSGTAFAQHILAPNLSNWQEQYPEISIDLSVGDHRIDPISEQIDITIRVGPLENSDLIAVRLGTVKRIIAASPQYLAKHGTPNTPEDLLKHNCLLLKGFPHQANWPFRSRNRRINITATGTFKSDSAETLLQAALSGAGIIRLGDFLGADALAEGKLVPLLQASHYDDPHDITALIPPGRQSIPRLRAFIDFIKTLL